MRRFLHVSAPVVAVLVPKCPLCLVPIAAALGITMPASSLALEAVFATMIGLSLFAVKRFRIAAACGAAVAIAGRSLDIPLLLACGAAMMLVAAVLARRRCAC